MAYPDADRLGLNEEGIVRTDYMETDHYRVMKNFMNNHEGMLRQLLSRPT